MASTNDEADIDDSVTSGNALIDGLLTEYHWSHYARTFFAFAIPDSETDYEATRDGLIDDYPDDNHVFVTTMPAFMVAGIRTAILEYQNIVNFAIPESADNSIDTQLRYGFITNDTTGDDPDPPAYAWTPQDDGLGSDQDNWKSGDMFYNASRFSVSGNPGGTLVGTYQYHTILHETGHALGLKHGHVAENGNAALPAAWDSMEFTVMTYRSYVGSPILPTGYTVAGGHFAQTLMMLDIQALQYLYGPDFTTQSGDTSYKWDQQGKYLINGSEQWDTATNTIFLTIWDGGGIDTYDFSAFTTAQFIDLTPGRSSNLGTQLATLGPGQTARGNVFNALLYNNDARSLIENATGGRGADTIQGNSADNRLDGGLGAGGDDVLGLGGSDTLIGGAGADELYGGELYDNLSGGDNGDLLNGGTGFDIAAYTSPAGETVTLTPNGASLNGQWSVTGPAQATGDILTLIEGFVFGNGADVITLGGPTGIRSVSIDGTGGNDIITGHRDYEKMIGGLGSDSLRPQQGQFDVFGGAQGTAPGTWIESLAQNDQLILDRRSYGADYTFYAEGFVASRWDGSDNSTARGIARIDYSGSAFKDFVHGALGSDVLRGFDGDDQLIGRDGLDTLEGGNGVDILTGGEGDDALSGGADRDILDAGEGSDTLLGGLGNDHLDGGNGHDRLETGGGGDTFVSGQAGDDTLIGSNDGEIFNGGSNDDRIEASGGSDHLDGGTGNDTLLGGASDDTIVTGVGVENIDGGLGVDTLIIDRAATVLGVAFVLKGPLASTGSDGTRVIGVEHLFYFGGRGSDRITGHDGNDRLTGNNGLDTLNGGNGIDVLAGGIGNDSLTGGSGSDNLDGGEGHDTLMGGLGVDGLVGGIGNDRLETGGGGDTLVSGQAGDDTLIGADDGEFFQGGDNNDRIEASGGNDHLDGGAGNDTLLGGAGNNTMVSGLDNDIMVFQAGIGNNSVSDFDADGAGGQDRLDVKAFAYGTFSNMLAAGVTITASGGNTVIDFGAGRPDLTLFGVTPAAMSGADFIF